MKQETITEHLFMADLIGLCRKYGFSLGESQGKVMLYNEEGRPRATFVAVDGNRSYYFKRGGIR
jgi:hypothetical protein